MRLVLTDTPACGMARDEQPICSNVSPNSQLCYSAVPSWMRIILRSAEAASQRVVRLFLSLMIYSIITKIMYSYLN